MYANAMKVQPARARVAARCVITLGLSLAATACSDDKSVTTAAAGNALQQARAAKTIKVGFANEAPYAYLDIASGKLTGEAPEIARVILGEMGIEKVEGVLTEFGSLIPGLKAKRFDVIAAGMYVLPERCKQIAFSNPTYSVGDGFAVAKGNPYGLHSYADMARQPTMRLGVVAGAVQRTYARSTGIPDTQVVNFPEAPSALEGLMADRVNAYAGTRLTVNYLLTLNKSGQLESATPFTDPLNEGKPIRGYGAFGFRTEDAELLKAFNLGLAKFIGTKAHADLVGPFGFTDLELPGKVTAETLCKG